MQTSNTTIVWDNDNDRRYEHGIDHGILFVMNSATPTGVAWNGLSNVTLSPEGAEPTDIYADNIKYLTLLSAETLKLTIEAYSAPKEFGVCDGTISGNGISVFQQNRTKFAFAFRTNGGCAGDTAHPEHHKIYIVYNCLASPAERAYETINDSPDAQTLSWDVSTTPVVPGSTYAATYKPTSLVCIEEYTYGKASAQATVDTWNLNPKYTTVETALNAGTFESLDTILALVAGN